MCESARPLTPGPVTLDLISLHLVEKFERNLQSVIIMYVRTAAKLFKVRGQSYSEAKCSFPVVRPLTSISHPINRLRNDLKCVEWDVKPCATDQPAWRDISMERFQRTMTFAHKHSSCEWTLLKRFSRSEVNCRAHSVPRCFLSFSTCDCLFECVCLSIALLLFTNNR